MTIIPEKKVTRISHTGTLIFLDLAPIMWYSTQQNRIQILLCGSKFVAIKIPAGIIKGLSYKIWIFHIHMDDTTNLFCDNQHLCNNFQMTDSTLKKNHFTIYYHIVREICASGVMRVSWESGNTKLADVLTKLISEC